MAIIVVCRGCRKTFQVSDKFAGKTGPCPNCKRPLQVPDKSEQVKIHEPEEFAGGGKSVSGKLLLKPEAFVPTKAEPVAVVLIVAAIAVVLGLALVGRFTGAFENVYVLIAGLLVISPPLVVAGYAILRDPEYQPYRGKQLYIRSMLCALAYAALWGIFAFLKSRGLVTGELWIWLYVIPPFLIIGGMFAFATLDFEYGDAVFHYSFYVLATIIIRWVAGLKWLWE